MALDSLPAEIFHVIHEGLRPSDFTQLSFVSKAWLYVYRQHRSVVPLGLSPAVTLSPSIRTLHFSPYSHKHGRSGIALGCLIQNALQVIGQPFERVQEIIIEYLVRNILKDTERDDVPLLVDAVASSATLPNTLTRLSIATSVVVPQTMFGWVSKIACFSHLTSLSLEYDYHRGSHDKKQLLVEVVIANLGHGVLPNLTKLALPLPLQSPEDKWIWDFSSFTTVIDMKFYENFIGKGVCLSTYLHKGLDATHYCPPVDLGRLLEFTSLMPPKVGLDVFVSYREVKDHMPCAYIWRFAIVTFNVQLLIEAGFTPLRLLRETPPNYPELLSILPNLEQLLIQEPDFVLNLMRRRYDTMRANPQFTRGGGMQQEDTRVKKALRARGIDVRYFPTFSLDK